MVQHGILEELEAALAAVKPAQAPADLHYLQTGARLAHAKWMLSQMWTFTDVEKLNRWIGFVQGVLWAEGRATIDDLRAQIH
jgi:hypothetical protein